MELTPDELNRYLPHYLTEAQKTGLAKAFAEFPNCNYYTSAYPEDMLQGDGWSKLDVFNFKNAERREIKGIFLSNSCDVDPNNHRDIPTKITFAPLIPLSSYVRLLQVSGLDQGKIDQKVQNIRAQKTTSIFFLPSGGPLDEDYIACLDDLHSVPVEHFSTKEDRRKVFTLSQVAFYIFVMKLSIHFCRMHEGVVRDMKMPA